MKKTRYLPLLFTLLAGLLFSSCSEEEPINVDYTFEVAKDVKYDIDDFDRVEYSTNNNLDLGFYEGDVWIKLEIYHDRDPKAFMVNPNLTHDEFKLYDFN